MWTLENFDFLIFKPFILLNPDKLKYCVQQIIFGINMINQLNRDTVKVTIPECEMNNTVKI